MLLKFIIILVVAVITFIVIRIFSANDWPDNIEILDLKTLKNGDLITKSYNGYIIQNYFHVMFSGSVWHHTGMVVIKDNEPFILEFTTWAKKSPRLNFKRYYEKEFKLKLVPYKEYLKKNLDIRICINRFNGKQISTETILNIYNNYKNYEYDAPNLNWIRLILDRPYTKTKARKFVCYEIIVHLLQELNIVKKLKMPSSYMCKDLVNCNLDMETNYNYSKPVEINVPLSFKLLE
jgi:hypothetical protein